MTGAPSLGAIAALVARDGLAIRGAFHPGPPDLAPETCGTLVLLGPGAGFWEVFTAAPEYSDTAAEPLDRWSVRVIGAQARALGAEALFPFGGPPWHPFIAWARRGGQVWEAPVGLLVHETAGLFVSFRGALAVPARIALPEPGSPPCPACAAPCAVACPAGALTSRGYDVAGCRAYLDTPAGLDCLSRGCAVRRACPVGAGLRLPAQSAFHMKAFHSGAAR